MKSDSLSSSLQDRPKTRLFVNCAVTVGSVLICLLISPTRLPGMELAGIAPNWLLIWVVVWSVKRTMFQGALAGLTLGLIQDGMTFPDGMTSSAPTHAISLAIVGILTARIRKERYIQEDFISVALIAFGMAVISETVTAIQYTMQGDRSLIEIWNYHQFVSLSSAILSSLWAPVVYFPLNRWWQRMNDLEQQS